MVLGHHAPQLPLSLLGNQMNAATVDAVDALTDELAIPVMIIFSKVNRTLRRQHRKGEFDWKDSVDMDCVLLNFPFLY